MDFYNDAFLLWGLTIDAWITIVTVMTIIGVMLFSKVRTDALMLIAMEKSALRKLEVALEEAAVNIMTYSHATDIELKLQRSAVMVSVTLTDNGIPFDPTRVETDPAKAYDAL